MDLQLTWRQGIPDKDQLLLEPYSWHTVVDFAPHLTGFGSHVGGFKGASRELLGVLASTMDGRGGMGIAGHPKSRKPTWELHAFSAEIRCERIGTMNEKSSSADGCKYWLPWGTYWYYIVKFQDESTEVSFALQRPDRWLRLKEGVV
jgi:hypothetical protein